MRDVRIYLTQVYCKIPADVDRTAFPLTLSALRGSVIAPAGAWRGVSAADVDADCVSRAAFH